MITVAIDFDGTITAIPKAIAAAVDAIKASGNRAIVVTRRYDTPENHAEVERVLSEHSIHVDRVLFAGALQKRPAAANAGESVAIWIDDSPETIAAIPIRPAVKYVPKRPMRR